MMDWRIGRLIRPNFIVALSGPAGFTIPQNRQRVGLIISSSTSDQIQGETITLAFGGNIFFLQNCTMAKPTVLSVTEYGSIIEQQLDASQAGNNATTFITELTLPESYLAAGLEQFESEYSSGRS